MPRTDSLKRSAVESLESVLRIVQRPNSELELHSLRTAQSQAIQAAKDLSELVGHYEALHEIQWKARNEKS